MQIKDLPASTTLASTDAIAKETSDGTTQKMTAANLASQIKSLGGLVSTTEMNTALSGKQNTLTFDTTPTTGSTNPVTSGGVATAIQQSTAINDRLTTRAGTLGANVINAAKNAPIGISFYKDSNQPVNRPDDMDWGAYLFIKGSNTNCAIMFLSNDGFACCYGLNPETATSIKWFRVF